MFQQFENSPVGQVEKLMAFQQFSQAIEAATQIIRQMGSSTPPKVYRMRANCYVNIGQPSNAIKDCDKLLSLKNARDERKNAFTLRANAYIQLADTNKAEADAIEIGDRSLLSKCRDLASHIKKANQKVSEHNNDEAIPILDIINQVSPGATSYKLVRANIAWEVGDFHKFLEIADSIKDNYPNDAVLHYRIGVSKMCQNDLHDAQNILKRTLKLKGSPSNTSLAINAIDSIRKESRDIESRLNSKVFVEVNQSIDRIDSFARSFCHETSQLIQYVLLQRVKVAKLSLEPHGTLQYLNDLVTKYPNTIDFVLERAEIHVILEDYNAALFDYQTVYHRDQQNRRAVEGIQRVQKLQKEASYVDYYKVLNLTKDAHNSDIQKAYRKAVMMWHPDKFSDKIKKKEAEQKMKEINKAFDIIGDPAKRRTYDQGEDPENPEMNMGAGFPFGDIFKFFQQGAGGDQDGGGFQGGFQGGQGFHFGNGGGENFQFEFHF